MYSVIVLYVQYMYCTVGREKNCVVESLSAAATMESVVALDAPAPTSCLKDSTWAPNEQANKVSFSRRYSIDKFQICVSAAHVFREIFVKTKIISRNRV